MLALRLLEAEHGPQQQVQSDRLGKRGIAEARRPRRATCGLGRETRALALEFKGALNWFLNGFNFFAGLDLQVVRSSSEVLRQIRHFKRPTMIFWRVQPPPIAERRPRRFDILWGGCLQTSPKSPNLSAPNSLLSSSPEPAGLNQVSAIGCGVLPAGAMLHLRRVHLEAKAHHSDADPC